MRRTAITTTCLLATMTLGTSAQTADSSADPVQNASPADPTLVLWQQAMDSITPHLNAGDRDEALAVAQQAADIASQIFPRGDERLFKTQLTLSSMLMQSGDMEQAISIATTIHADAEDRLALASKQVATTLKFLGAARLLERDFEGAEAIYERAVQLSEFTDGPDHPETAKHIGNLATATLQLGQTRRTRDLLDRALTIWDGIDLPHPVYASQAMTLLAQIHVNDGDLDAAIELYDRGLKLQEAAFGLDSPRLNKITKAYVGVLRQAGRIDDADALEQRMR